MRFYQPLQSLIVLLALHSTVACNRDDTGKLCGSPNVVVPATPVEGEVPVVTVVNITRDANCLTFDCLTQKGLPSYCTKTCSYNTPTTRTCNTDADCTSGSNGLGTNYHCATFDGNNFCTTDDCPSGFWCNPVATVGPFAGKLYCQRQTGCFKDVDCNAPGDYSCVPYACFGNCLLNPSTCGSAQNQLICEADQSSRLQCNCNGFTDNPNLLKCSANQLSCTPTGENIIPAGDVSPLNVCMPN